MDADVAIVGYGPVGQLAAALLGAQGLRVLVLEREVALHPLPRAAAIDDEGLRLLDDAGLLEAARPELVLDVPVAFTTRAGREVRLVDPAITANGHPFVSLLHQPGLERVLDAAARATPGVTVRWGAEVVALVQDDAGARMRLADGEEVRAGWVVACDGARSPIRDGLGIPFGGSTFAESWLVVDLELAAPRTAPPVMRFHGDPGRPRVSAPLGRLRERWELMLLPGEDPEALRARAGEELAAHVDLRGARVERATIYTYHARRAARWRAGRVLLAGDAAHVMPPFAGQGMCSGLRDVHNLAWKLAAVVRGEADAGLLDSYEAERRPHVEAMSRLAVTMGAILQTRRPRAAALRDVVLRALSGAPVLGPLARGGGPRPGTRFGQGALGPGGGALFPQPRIGGRGLDAWLAPGRWALLGAGEDPFARLGPAARAAFAGAGALAVPAVLLSGAELVVLRPDRVVFARDAADGAAAAGAYGQAVRGGSVTRPGRRGAAGGRPAGRRSSRSRRRAGRPGPP